MPFGDLIFDRKATTLHVFEISLDELSNVFSAFSTTSESRNNEGDFVKPPPARNRSSQSLPGIGSSG